jgi:hypothetical protein
MSSSLIAQPGSAVWAHLDTVNLTLSDAQETPDIAYADGAFHIVWSKPGTGQVRYRRTALSDDTGIHDVPPMAGMRLRFDREDGRLYFTASRQELWKGSILWDTG